jgi:hypothetical protein
MINRSNLVALVGFKETPFATPEKLAIFDDSIQIFYYRCSKDSRRYVF